MEFCIRDVAVRPAAVLAPMEGVTDVLFRRLIRQIGGCGMTWTEFVPAVALAEEHKRALRTVEIDVDEHPIAIQIYGRDPEVMADGARYAQEHGADVVDVNFGCPSKKVCAHSGGSSLLKEPELARAIVRAVRAAVSIPFTVKMRTGWDPTTKNAPEIARMCQDEGVEGLTVHWRTRADLYGGERELDTIARVVASVSIPVLANGDIVDGATAMDTLARTGAAGVMVGRGAVRNPWVFRAIEASMKGLPEPVIGMDERERVLVGMFASLEERFDSERAVLGRIKKLARYFGDGLPRGDGLRELIWHSATLAEARELTRDWFGRAREAQWAA
jgi:tRNA-dihydrouridine synthase B